MTPTEQEREAVEWAEGTRSSIYRAGVFGNAVEVDENGDQHLETLLSLAREALALREREGEMVEGLQELAMQKTVQEHEAEWGEEAGDYTEGYDAMVRHARALLARYEKEVGDNG